MRPQPIQMYNKTQRPNCISGATASYKLSRWWIIYPKVEWIPREVD